MLQDGQDLSSKTVVTRTVVTTITTQTQETKTVVTKEKPAEDPETTRIDGDSRHLSDGSTSMAEVLAQLRRAAPPEEVETIKFPSSPSAYSVRQDDKFLPQKDVHGDAGTLEENLTDHSQPEPSPRSLGISLLDVQGKHDITTEIKDPEERHQPASHFAKSKAEASPESAQLNRATAVMEKIDPKNSGSQKNNVWESLISISQGSGSGFGMLPAACRLLFFLIGFVIVLIAACGCASAALLLG